MTGGHADRQTDIDIKAEYFFVRDPWYLEVHFGQDVNEKSHFLAKCPELSSC